MQFLLPRRTILLWLLVLALAVAGAAAVLYLPRATITIHPQESERVVTRDIFLSTYSTSPDFTKYILPARVVQQTVEDYSRVERTGSRSDDLARGSIVLINERDEAQELLPKTHLRHEASGAYFLTDTPVTLPPQSRVAMTITAKEKGAAGNVAPGRFTIEKLPASLQTGVFGESTVPLTGGSRIDQPLPESELTLAREQLLASLRERLLGELTAEVGGAAIRPELLQLAVEEEASSAAVGSLASEYAVRLRVRGQAFVVDDTDLLSLTLLALRSSAGSDEEFVSYAPESFRVSAAKLDWQQGEARLQGTLHGTFARKIGPTALSAENIAGLNANEVRERFQQHPAVGTVDVSFFPFWVKTVPGRAGAVEIAIKGSQP
ncbi:MAG: hypothetical protein HY372_01365 [Candidatus Andersenbacteria bacterium]|nr:hypothetical protein [Candidatus Andersenbacteria bacterium]